MRVLHVISNLMSGGAESMLTKLVEALPMPAHEHVVVTFIDGGLFADRLSRQGVQVVGLGRRRSLGAVTALPELRRLVREIDPDVVQGWMYHGNLAASAAAQGRPVLWNVRQRLERLSDNRPQTRAVILAALPFRRSVAGVIYNSAKAAAEHEAWGYPAARRVLIPNGFDVEAFAPDPLAGTSLRAELGLGADTPLIGRIARDDAIKDTPTLLAAVATLGQPACLVLAGRGMTGENAALMERIRSLGLEPRVRLLGERSDIPRLAAAFDVAVLSSSHGEGFPNVVCEAMAAGTPVVSTDVGECAAILDDPVRIVPPRDPAALGRAIGAVLAMTPEQRRALGARDRARVVASYALPAVAARYAGLWSEVARAARSC